MPNAAPSPEPLDDAAHQRALAILLDVGTAIAQELKTPSPDTPVIARAKAFEAVALAVRRTILLARHITEHPAAATAPDAIRATQRKQVIRTVQETIDTKADPAKAPALHVELLERIDSLDFDVDIAHRAPADLIKEICRDLGLTNVPGMRGYPRRTPDDIALLCAQAAAPAGSGLPQWSAAATLPAPPAIQPDYHLTDRRHL